MWPAALNEFDDPGKRIDHQLYVVEKQTIVRDES